MWGFHGWLRPYILLPLFFFLVSSPCILMSSHRALTARFLPLNCLAVWPRCNNQALPPWPQESFPLMRCDSRLQSHHTAQTGRHWGELSSEKDPKGSEVRLLRCWWRRFFSFGELINKMTVMLPSRGQQIIFSCAHDVISQNKVLCFCQSDSRKRGLARLPGEPRQTNKHCLQLARL